MLEWMHDPDSQRGFKKNMMGASLEDAKDFCIRSKHPDTIKAGDSLHFAIVDDNDEYLGTASLKDIDFENGRGEYSVTLRRKAQSKGVASAATGLILQKAFRELGLHRVFSSLYADNVHSKNLVERCGFTCEGEFREHFRIDGEYVNWKWYGILDTEFDESRFEVFGNK